MNPIRRILSLAICIPALFGTARADDQEKLTKLRESIILMQREMDKTSESRSEAADDLRESERAISGSNRKLAELAGRLRSADIKLGRLEAQEQVLNNKLSGQQALLGKLLHQQYLGGKQEYLKLLLNEQNPNQAARNLQYYQYIARHRATWLSTLRNELSALNDVSDATREQRAELSSLRKDQAAQKETLEKKKKSRQYMLSKISKQLRQQRREIDRLKQNENHLAQLIEKLSTMLDQPGSGSLLRNDLLPDDRYDDMPFSQLKGKLALPVRGVIANRFNTPRPESTVLWKGIFLRTSSGQAVKAIAAGQVVFADWLRGFGNLLIIDHGKGYMSLYANNETLYKQVGDMLHGGDVIATTGNSGGNEDFGLYFELRYKSKPLDPVKWMSAKQL